MKRESLIGQLIYTLIITATASCGSLLVSGGGTDIASDNSTINKIQGDNGETKGQFSSSSNETQVLELADDSNLSGTKIEFPAGSLAIDTEITLEEGGSLANSLVASELSLSDPDAVTSAGPSVVIASSEAIDASTPFTLSLPLTESPSLNLVDTCENLVVIFKVLKASESGNLFVGIIPTKDLNISGNNVSFETVNFGAFQAACVAEKIEEKIELRTSVPIVKKHKANELVGSWASGCKLDHEEEEGRNAEYLIQSFAFSETVISVKMDIYDSSDCKSNHIMSFTLKADYSIGKTLDENTQKKELDFKVTETLVGFYQQQQIDGNNEQKICGHSDWVIGKPLPFDDERCVFDDDKSEQKQDTSSDPDAGTGPDGSTDTATNDGSDNNNSGPPKAGESLYVSFQVDGDKLLLSLDDETHDGSSPEARSETLETDNPLSRVN